MAQAEGVLTLLYHLKSRDADTSFRLARINKEVN